MLGGVPVGFSGDVRCLGMDIVCDDIALDGNSGLWTHWGSLLLMISLAYCGNYIA